MAVHMMDDGCVNRALKELRYGDLSCYGITVPNEMVFTGYKSLNYMLGGMLPGELYLIGARPSMGKSSFIYNLLSHMCVGEGVETLLFSTEDRAESVLRQILAIMTGNEYRYPFPFKPKDEITDNLDDAARELQMSPLLIDDSVYLTLDTFIDKCRKAKEKSPIRVVIIDSWRDMKIPSKLAEEDQECDIGDNQPQKLADEQMNKVLIDTFQRLKRTAKELEIIIIVNMGLSKEIEDRDDHYPEAYDFLLPAEAMDEATGILTLYRDSYYNYDNQDDEDFLYVVAHRRRNRGTVGHNLIWKPETRQVLEIDYKYEDEENKEESKSDNNGEIIEGDSGKPYSDCKQKMYPDIENADALLREICIDGINHKYDGESRKVALSRIEVELEIVRKQGSASGYLTVLKGLKAVEAKPEEYRNNGAIASSLLSYAIGLSDIEPLNAKPRLYSEFYYGINGEREPDFELIVTPDLQKRLRDYYENYPGKEPVTCIYSSWKTLEVVFVADLFNYYSLKEVYRNFSIVYHIVQDEYIPGISSEDKQILSVCKPETYEEYIKCYGLMRATGAWENAMLMRAERIDGEISFSEILANREDVYEFLLDHKMDKRIAFEITENVRKGKIHSGEWTKEMLNTMDKVNIPDWFRRSCKNILYLPPRALTMDLFKRYGKKEGELHG